MAFAGLALETGFGDLDLEAALLLAIPLVPLERF
jgi:hypothetical protein